MFIDLTLPVTLEMREAANARESVSRVGHLGTHFDVMDKAFPLDYLRRDAVVFDVSGVRDRDIAMEDIDAAMIREGAFVAFYSGAVDRLGYGAKSYFQDHPQLSEELIDMLLAAEIAIIGVDFAGVRRGEEHTPMDQKCADRGVFVVENLCGLQHILKGEKTAFFVANTYPVSFLGMTGLPCRVVAEV